MGTVKDMQYAYDVLNEIEILHAMRVQLENIENLKYILRGKIKQDYKNLERIKQRAGAIEEEKNVWLGFQESFLEFKNYWDWTETFFLEGDITDLAFWDQLEGKVEDYKIFVQMCKELGLDRKLLEVTNNITTIESVNSYHSAIVENRKNNYTLKEDVVKRMIQKQRMHEWYDQINPMLTCLFNDLEDCFSKNYIKKEVNMIQKKMEIIGDKITRGITKEETLLKVNEKNYDKLKNQFIKEFILLKEEHNKILMQGYEMIITHKQYLGKKLYELAKYKHTIEKRLAYQKKQSERYDNGWADEISDNRRESLQNKLAYHQDKLEKLENATNIAMRTNGGTVDLTSLQEKLDSLYLEKLQLKVKQSDKAILKASIEISDNKDNYFKLRFAK